MITIAIPKNSVPPNLSKEISSAKRIKDKKTRDNAVTGLNKIMHYL
jgi:hypothetical protein